MALVGGSAMSAGSYQPDTNPHTLRDRLAAAIQQAHSELHFSLADTWDDKCLRLADAVIAELDMGIPCATDGCRMRHITRRSAEKLGLTEVDDDG